jgi:hypothetical protein
LHASVILEIIRSRGVACPNPSISILLIDFKTLHMTRLLDRIDIKRGKKKVM